MITRWGLWIPISALLVTLPARVAAGDVLSNNGFNSCSGNADIKVERLNIKYDKTTRQVIFDVAGTSTKSQEVTAVLTVTAFGRQVYQRDFDPCDPATRVQQLCPVPVGTYAANGSQIVPAEYAKQIPDIAFNLPDLDGMAKLELKGKVTGAEVACVQSPVSNGKTISTRYVPYAAAGLAGAALILNGVSSLAAGATAGTAGTAGVAGPSPSFGDVVGWMQSMAMNGMLSVNYPPIYRSFTRNFGFSGLLIPWDPMQVQIDSFRAKTGGNLQGDSVEYLRNPSLSFVYTAGPNGTLAKRDTARWKVLARQLGIEMPGNAQTLHSVSGIQAFVEPLIIPQSNTFMTALLFLAVIIAAIIVGILLAKVVLEAAALMGKLGKGANNFRKRFWWIMAKTITNLMLLLYGIWTLYCVYQFTVGDSWVAKLLAGFTLAIFTGTLGFFSWRVWSLARMYKKEDGDASGLYDDKETRRNYGIFYESYKKTYWWVFIPFIMYMFARGVIIAAGDGHGMFQVIGQLIIEFLMLLMLAFFRPYARKSGNWINITIQVVRLLSILCILVFVDQLGIAKTPQTITGLILVIMQTVLTGLLAILIVVNGFMACCRTNPYRQARKEAQRSRDTLASLDTAKRRKYVSSSSYDYDPEVTNPNKRSSLDMPRNGYAIRSSNRPSSRRPILPQIVLAPALKTKNGVSKQWSPGYISR